MTGQTGTASQVPASDASAVRSWRVFPGKADQLRVVRRWLTDLLPPCEPLDDVILVASELGSNAVRHTASGQGGKFAVEIAWAADVVRVAVADEGGPSEPRIVEAADDEGGRGLLAVREVSAGTGFAGDGNGRLVWADVLWAERGGPPPQDSGWDPAAATGLDVLRTWFPEVPAWFGRATRQWWALATVDGEYRLVAAPEPAALAAVLATVRSTGRPSMAKGWMLS
jgi:serine/threonine-protein kinase RsbW